MTTLGEVADMLVGFSFKSAGFLEADSDGIALVRGDNVQQGSIRWGDKTKKWPVADYEQLQRYQLAEDDVILAMDRPIVGDGLKMAWMKAEDLPALLVQRVCRLRGREEFTTTQFLRYVIAAPAFSSHVQRITTGANIPHISGKDIASYELHLPDLDEQASIVQLLTAYDDLISTNQRRIQLLEDAARRLYREWFIHLRFPGYEAVPVKDGLPVGWGMLSLGELADINASTIGSKDRPDSVLYVDISSVKTGIVEQITPFSFAGAPGRARRRVRHGDIIWSCVRPNRRSYALIWEPDENLVVSTGFAVVSASKVPFSFLYFAITTDDFVGHLEQNATGAAYPAVTASVFETASVLSPTPSVMKDFDNFALPMLQQMETFKMQNIELARARDLLLPKLMSGQLDVSRITHKEVPT